jgi:hypothetical protein
LTAPLLTSGRLSPALQIQQTEFDRIVAIRRVHHLDAIGRPVGLIVIAGPEVS